MEKYLHEFDRFFYKKGFKYVAGLDEVGRGCLAGPVVAASVVLRRDNYFKGINDSKKLTKRQRTSLFWDILCKSEEIGIGIVDSDEIDRINILNATKHAMLNALNDLTVIPEILLIDAISLQSVKIEQVSVIKGDSKSAAIAAASVIAKVVRDRIMMHYHEIYPEYDFKSHKGYGTKDHLDKINNYGPCDIHRKSFSPVCKIKLPFHSS